ncbi:MAG: glycosyltransferase family 87 protein [Phycisphaerae bacterium]
MKQELPARVPPSQCATLSPPIAPRGVRLACLTALLGLVVYFAILGGQRIARREADFQYFYHAGTALLEHGELDRGYDYLPKRRTERRGTIEWYLPFVSRFMTLFAWLPFEAAGTVWLTLNLVAFLTILVLLGRHLMGLPPQDWPVTLLVPVLLMVLFWHWEFRLNQIDILTMLLLVASFVQWQQRRRNLAGFWLGLAVLIKIMPMLMVVWFTLKRQYRTVAVALLTIVLAGPVSDLIVFRPAYTLDAYRQWVHIGVGRSSHRGLVLNQLEMDWRNQGLGAVASRWLHPTNYVLHFDNDPRIKTDKPPGTMNVLDLSREAVATVVMAVVALSAVGLLWLARRPASELNLWQLRTEWALFFLALLWLMPVLRRYHLVLTLPALAMLGSGIHYAAGRRVRWVKLSLACISATLVAQIAILTRELPESGVLSYLEGFLSTQSLQALSNALDSGIVEASGVLLLAVWLLAIPLVTLLLRLGREPDAMPKHAYAPPHPDRSFRSLGGDRGREAEPVAARA